MNSVSWVIIGIVVFLCVIFLILLVCVYFLKKKPRQQKAPSPQVKPLNKPKPKRKRKPKAKGKIENFGKLDSTFEYNIKVDTVSDDDNLDETTKSNELNPNQNSAQFKTQESLGKESTRSSGK